MISCVRGAAHLFGYVFPDKPELKVKDFAHYRTVYCSLCETLRGYGLGAKALLNYDFTFAAMLCMSVRNETPVYYTGRCNTNPFLRERLIEKNASLELSAAALLVSARHKLRDDLADEGFFKRIGAALALAGLSVPFKRAAARLPEFDAAAEKQTERQKEFEQKREDNLDLACEPTAQMLSFLLESMAETEETARILRRLGYLLGRFVYLADALDDLAGDISRGRYNPLALRYSLDKSSSKEAYDEAVSEARAQLNHAAGETQSCYRLLQTQLFKDILDNIIYLGLRATAATVGTDEKKGRGRYGQSLSGAGA